MRITGPVTAELVEAIDAAAVEADRKTRTNADTGRINRRDAIAFQVEQRSRTGRRIPAQVRRMPFIRTVRG